MHATTRRITACFAITGVLLVGSTGVALTGVSAAPAATGSASAAAAGSGDVGYEGQSFEGATGSPSGSKPESKLWYNDGSWWASLVDAASDTYFIYRFDPSSHTWAKTSTVLDSRPDSRSDALWDGTHLYVASHRFKDSDKGSSSTTTVGPSYNAYLYRYSYDPSTDTYSLDGGFPTIINQARTETLVIDEDSTGAVWATWKQDTNIYVVRSAVGGTSWSTPFILPSSTTVTPDDISSVLSFGSNKVGVMWSDQVSQKMYFQVHTDGTNDLVWTAPEVAYQGTDAADDHINLKGISDQNGRILAAVKTSLSSSANPLVVLLDRAASGVWTNHVFGTVADKHTRPIVLIDTEHATVHMFATAGQSGGTINEKTAPLSNPTFPSGQGKPILVDADSPDINNATSTKQNVTSSTGLVVLATNDTTRHYWTHWDNLGGPQPK